MKKDLHTADTPNVKTFVLDTNVLLHSAQSIECFQDNDVVIPMAVVEELDKFKKNNDELGRNARRVIRHLDRLREVTPSAPGKLAQGVPLSAISASATGKLYVLAAGMIRDHSNDEISRIFGDDLSASSPDNRILRVACELKKQHKRVIFISKDINLRLKADALGLHVMDFERGKVNTSRLYTGFSNVECKSSEIDQLYRNRELQLSGSSRDRWCQGGR